MSENYEDPIDRLRRKARDTLKGQPVSIDGLQLSSEREKEVNLLMSGLFGNAMGTKAVNYLESVSTRRVLTPSSSSIELAYMEGARWIVGLIRTRMKLGQAIENASKPVSGRPPKDVTR